MGFRITSQGTVSEKQNERTSMKVKALKKLLLCRAGIEMKTERMDQ